MENRNIFKYGIMHSSKRDVTKTNDFDILLPHIQMPSQGNTGYCWIFSGLSILEQVMYAEMKEYHLRLSPTYLVFYDKLEKSNAFLENILTFIMEPNNSRIMEYLLKNPAGDSGQWNMFRYLVESYGVIPYTEMEETWDASSTSGLNICLNAQLRKNACLLHQSLLAGEEAWKIREKKQFFMQEIYNILSKTLGIPPQNFIISSHIGNTEIWTAKTFFQKNILMNLKEYVSVINDPNKEYYCIYRLAYVGYSKENSNIEYYNLPCEDMKRLTLLQLQSKNPVWFGCDAEKMFDRAHHVFDINSYEIDKVLGIQFHMTKAEQLAYGQTSMQHAMVFQGVKLDSQGKPIRWLVQNSQGTGEDCEMTDEWFSQYVFQTVINKEFLDNQYYQALNGIPRLIYPWDSFGTLAKGDI